MRRIVLALVAAFAFAACGESLDVQTVTDRIAGELECVEVREDPAGEWGACDLEDGTTVAVVLSEGGDTADDVFVAMSKDDGTLGPWILGDGWSVAITSGDLELGTRIHELVGGELRAG